MGGASITDVVARRPGWKGELAGAAMVGAFLGLVGPFGSYLGVPVVVRVAYWASAVVFGSLIFGTAVRAVIGRRWSTYHSLSVLALLTVVLAWPYARLTAWAGRTIWPSAASVPPLEWYLQVLAIALPLVVAGLLAAKRRPREPASLDPLTGTELFGVDERRVLCLQMEDHYVRVHTVSGSKLVLATMGQARAAMRTAGLQVHRSWWVADHAVDEVITDGRNLRVRLRNDITAPISRSSVARVRQAGWLDRTRTG